MREARDGLHLRSPLVALGSDNLSAVPRRAIFIGYTYPWVRPRDNYPIDWECEPYRDLSPVRKQVLGWGEDAMSFWGLGDDHFPVRDWLERQNSNPTEPR